MKARHSYYRKGFISKMTAGNGKPMDVERMINEVLKKHYQSRTRPIFQPKISLSNVKAALTNHSLYGGNYSSIGSTKTDQK